MSVTYGFYNSYNGDRRYTAEQLGAIFDGIIEEGVYQKYTRNNVKPFFIAPGEGGMGITVDFGRAWLRHTWTFNDGKILIELPPGDPVYPRVDAVILDVNLITRKNTIRIATGDINRQDRKPVLTWDTVNDHYEYLIGYLERPKNATLITESQIRYKVADVDSNDVNYKNRLNWVTAPLQSYEISTYVSGWEAAWNEWFRAKVGNGETGEYPTSWNSWINQEQSEFTEWRNQEQSEFTEWLRNANRSIPSSTTADLITRLEATENMLAQIRTDGGYTYENALEDAGGASLYDDTGAALTGRTLYVLAGQEG